MSVELTRKQVKALLGITGKDDTRPALTELWVAEHGDNTYLVATDSYRMALLKLDMAPELDIEHDVGQELAVPRQELEKWYKLAKGRDILIETDVINMLEVSEHKHPKIDPIMAREPAEARKLSFNAKYALELETLAGDPLTYELGGDNGALIANTRDNYYILMPLRS